jgi:hypothetical protein
MFPYSLLPAPCSLFFDLTDATQIDDVAHFADLVEDLFELVAIENILSQFNYSWLTVGSFN